MLGVYLSIKTNSLTGRNISLFAVFDLSTPLKISQPFWCLFFRQTSKLLEAKVPDTSLHLRVIRHVGWACLAWAEVCRTVPGARLVATCLTGLLPLVSAYWPGWLTESPAKACWLDMVHIKQEIMAQAPRLGASGACYRSWSHIETDWKSRLRRCKL